MCIRDRRHRGRGPKPGSAASARRTVPTVSTRAQRFARRCFFMVQRLSRRLSVMVRLFPGFAALVLILVAALVEALMLGWPAVMPLSSFLPVVVLAGLFLPCLLYTSDAADDLTRVDLGGR